MYPDRTMQTIDRWLEAWWSSLHQDALKYGVIAALFVVLFFVERAFPAERGQSMKGRLRNVVLGVLYFAVGYMAFSAFMLAFPIEVHPNHETQPGKVVLIFVAYILAFDFLYYWYHRAQHRFTWLWAIHELHHADAELNVTTSYRTYWLELLVQNLVIALPIYLLLGQNSEALVGVLVVANFFLLFTHSNLRLGLGPLTSFICGPQVHRIHHSRLPEHQDRNFAQIFTIYDRIFGTYYAPQKTEYPPTGTVGLASDASLLRDFIKPFSIWGKNFWSPFRHRDVEGPASSRTEGSSRP
jgi:sterol desaturase/sphingolipid hydroxylase (fatty acid hydroxylase superfamily)